MSDPEAPAEQRPSVRRQRRFRRLALWTGAILLAGLLLMAGALAWLVATPSGLQFALGQARPFLPEGTRIESAEGRLVGPLRVNGIEVATPAARVRVERVELDWSPAALLEGVVHVDRLDADTVGVTLNATEPETESRASAGMPALPRDIAPPLGLRVERLAVAPIEVVAADGSARRIDRVVLRARADEQALVVESLRVDAPEGRVAAALRIDVARPHGVDGQIDWRFEAGEGVPPLAGQGQFSGTLEDLQFTHRLDEPTTMRLDGALRLFRDEPEWHARLELPTTRPAEWLAEAPPLAIGLGLDLAGTLEQASVSGDYEIGDVEGGPYRGRVDLVADRSALRIDQWLLRSAVNEAAKARLSGTVGYADGPPRFDLYLGWEALQWPLAGEALARSPQGHLELTGTPDAYRLEGHFGADPGLSGLEEVADVRLSARGSTTGLDSLRGRADWAGAGLDVTGDVSWAGPGQGRLQATLEGVDPARFGAAVTGELGARIAARAEWGEPGLRGEAELERLQGTLDGRPVAGAGRARFADGVLELPRLRLSAGEARFEASGRAGEQLALDWSLRIPDVRALVGEGEGRLTAEGRVAGPAAAPAIEARVGGEGLAWDTLSIGRLALTADATLARDRRSRIDLRLEEIGVGEQRLEGIEAELDGSLGAHTLVLEARAPAGEIDTALSGSLDGADWNGRVDELRLQPAGHDAWVLAEPAPMRWRAGRGELERACLAQGAARLCARGGGAADDWSARIEARDVPLSLIREFGPPDLQYTGRIGLQADLVGGGGDAVTGSARLDLTRGRVTGPVDGKRRTLLAWQPGVVEAMLAPERVDARVELPLTDGGRLGATLGVTRDARAGLEGRIRAEIDDFGLIAAVVPQVGGVEGRLVADMGLSGTVADPRLDGQAELVDGRVQVVPLGIEVTQLGLDLKTVGRGLRADLTGYSGEGSLQARIEFRRDGDGAWLGEGRITGEDFEAAALPELELTVSPKLRWRVEGREIRLDGNLGIPAALIAPRDLSNTVQPSPDTVIVGTGQDGTDEPPGWRVIADVRVGLGDDVRIDAFGLDGRLGGDIRVREQPGRLTSASGELRVEEGTYSIYRQTLEIERGRVLFDSGPIADPGLDVRAVRRPRDVLVGVNVRGTLREPRATLFSEPPMPQSQQLSYLIAGVPLNESSGDDRSTMAAAAAALATSEQGQALAGKLGIEEVSVDQGRGENEGASLVLGRYLSPRLYVGYGIGLAEQANSVRMRYELTRRWSIQARSGTAASADLLYSIETNGEPGE